MYTLSFIIPVYNGEKYIRQALESILKQPCDDWEIIVVDDGSNDNTERIVQEYVNDCNKIKFLRQKNSGASVARNIGIKKAKGKYIAFLDADDVLFERCYTKELQNLINEMQYDIFSFAFYIGTEDLKRGKEVSVKDNELCTEGQIRLLNNHFSSFIYRKELLSKYENFPEGIYYDEDKAFLYIALNRAKSLYQKNIPWFVYRNNPGSLLHQKNKVERLVKHNIKAWVWVKNNCSELQSNDCDSKIFNIMMEYIQIASLEQNKFEDIMRTYNSCEAFKETLNNYGKFWIHPKCKQTYKYFRKYPYIYVCVLKILGVPYMILKIILRDGWLRKMYLNCKYKEDLSINMRRCND